MILIDVILSYITFFFMAINLAVDKRNKNQIQTSLPILILNYRLIENT